MSRKPMDFSVEAYVGLPGSGKSFACVRRLKDELLNSQRPCYTNLPLRRRVFSKWLTNRGGKQLNNLLHALTEKHFRRFIERAAWKSEMEHAYREFCVTQDRTFLFDDFESVWRFIAGDDITKGPAANWIPAGAYVIIDEVHLWFSMQNQKKDEPPELEKYITMHRHHMHTVWWCSQAERQVSITLRTNTAFYWKVWQRGEERIGLLTLKDLGMRGLLGYAKYTKEEWEKDPARRLCVFQETVYSWLPTEKWIFRLYDSFTHVGGIGRMMRQLERMRKEAGVDQVELGPSPKEVAQMKYGRWCLLVLLGMVLGGVLVKSAGNIVRKPVHVPAMESAAETSPRKKEDDTAWASSLKLTSVGRTSAWINKKAVKRGSTFSAGGKDAFVVYLDQKNRGLVVARDGWLWRLSVGESKPTSIGAAGDVLKRIRDHRDRSGGRGTVGVSAPAVRRSLASDQGDGRVPGGGVGDSAATGGQ